MRYYSKKKKLKSNLIATTQKQFIQGLVFLICMSLVIIFIFGDHGLIKLYKIKTQREKVQNHIAQLRQEREKRKEEKNKIENDLDYIEKIAREKYKMVKPGEKVFKVVEN
jgi:cell division protein FtsB|tara:strand:+ start:407 stop:736 length:330 start_codon:yes stop_codon:yes gene_type:complete